MVGQVEHHQPQSQRGDHDSGADEPAQRLAKFRINIGAHGISSSSAKEGEPKREGDERSQARINQNREDDWYPQTQQEPPAQEGQRNTEDQAQQPRRKERAQNVE